jgi:hypothetical protein
MFLLAWSLVGLLVSQPRVVSIELRPEQTGVVVPVMVPGEVGRLVREEKGQRIEAWGQAILQPDGSRKVVYLLPPAERAGEQIWRWEPAPEAPRPFRFVERDGGRLELMEEGRPVLVYNFGPQLKEGVPERYRREDYVHPLYDLDGTVITDDFPRDHYHHRGLFWAWPEVRVDERTYDPWACRGIQHRFERWLSRETGPVCAVLGIQGGWYLGDRRVVREIVWLEVYRAGSTGRMVDITLTLEAEDEPIRLRGRSPKKGYGGFTLRFAPHHNEVITIPQGRLTQDGVHVQSPWADFSARFGSREALSGAAIFDHPRNPQHPPYWLLRHYGVLNPEWPALGWATLERGRPVTLRYRIWIHRGDAQKGRVANAYAVWEREPFMAQGTDGGD